LVYRIKYVYFIKAKALMCICIIKVTLNHRLIKKVTAIPLQAWTGLEGSRRLRLPDFKTVGT